MRLIKSISQPVTNRPSAKVGNGRRAAYGVVRALRRAAATNLVPAFYALGLIGFGVSANAETRVGDAFPLLAKSELSGGALPATEGKVMLVDFWASWCAPCKASFPAFGRLHAEFAERGLVIVAVSVDENPAAFTAFVKKYQPPFATLLDGTHKLVEMVHVPAMPTSYLIGRDGRLRFVHAGFHGAVTEQELHSQIETLLAENAGPKS